MKRHYEHKLGPSGGGVGLNLCPPPLSLLHSSCAPLSFCLLLPPSLSASPSSSSSNQSSICFFLVIYLRLSSSCPAPPLLCILLLLPPPSSASLLLLLLFLNFSCFASASWLRLLSSQTPSTAGLRQLLP